MFVHETRGGKPNKSLDASGGSVFRKMLGAAKGVLIRAAASTPPLDVFMSLRQKHSAALIIAMLVCFGVSVAKAEPRTPRKFDEFGHLSCSDELIRLDNYGDQFRTGEDALAVIIVYAGYSGTKRGEVIARLFAIRDALTRRKSVDTTRIILLDGGFRRNFAVELWIIPPISPYGLETVRYLITSDEASGKRTLRGPIVTTWQYNCDRSSR